MKRYTWFTLILLHSIVQAQSVSTFMGARAAGMGYASVVIRDEYSLFNNVGSMAAIDKPSAFFAYEASPALPGASRAAAGILTPSKAGVFGVGLFRFGDDLYSEQMVTAAFGNKLGIASLGASLQYVQYQAGSYGTKGSFTVNFGGCAQITHHITVGAFMVNLTQAGLSPEEPLPVKLVAGIGFKPDERFIIATEVEKDLTYPATWKTGAEYVIHKKVFVRSGFNLNPNTAFFGLGAKTTRLKADYAISYNALLGETHQVSSVIQLENKKKRK